MLNAKVLNKKIATTEEGIFYKEVINDKGNIVDKVYLLRYRENFMDKQITIGREKSGFNLKMCKAKRIAILSKIQNGEYTGKKYKITFGEVFDKYIEHAKVNKKTWKQDENAFEFHLKGLKKFDLRHLKSEIFETLKLKKLEEGYKPRTVQYILGLARQVINHAITYDLITNYTNPISKNKVKMPTYDNKQVGFLTKGQAKKLLETLKANPYQLSYRLTILLLYSGARFSEVASLTWNDIDFNNKLIYFKSSKKGNDRKVYIPTVAMKLLEELYNEKSSDLIIPSRNGKQLIQMPKQWQEEVDKLLPNNNKAGKYRITTHSLRHTHASWMAISGLSILHIKEQLGHKKLEMTMRYSHLIPNERYESTQVIFDNL